MGAECVACPQPWRPLPSPLRLYCGLALHLVLIWSFLNVQNYHVHVASFRTHVVHVPQRSARLSLLTPPFCACDAVLLAALHSAALCTGTLVSLVTRSHVGK